jgi:hypothetical protein
MLFGRSSAAYFILPMLEATMDTFVRYRDCFLGDDARPEYNGTIQVYTRLGGGNREYYETEIDRLRQIPGYICDLDDDFDFTYATFYYKVPSKWQEDFDRYVASEYNPSVFSEEYKQVILSLYPDIPDQIREAMYPSPNGETGEQ